MSCCIPGTYVTRASSFAFSLVAFRIALPDFVGWRRATPRSNDRARRPYNIIKAQVKAVDRLRGKGRATRSGRERDGFFFFFLYEIRESTFSGMTNGIQDQRYRSELSFNSAVERFKEAHIRPHVGAAVWVMNSENWRPRAMRNALSSAFVFHDTHK